MADEQTKDKAGRISARCVQNNLGEHTSDKTIHMNRRQMIGVTAGSVAGVLAAKGLISTAWEWGKQLKPKFDVYIFSDERLEKAELSDEQRALIEESNSYRKLNGYIGVGFETGKGLASARIYRAGSLLGSEVNEDGNVPIIERVRWPERFTFVADSPDFREKVVKTRVTFLGNEKLLARVVEGERLGSDEDEVFYCFSIGKYSDETRLYHSFGIPKECTLQLRGDPVRYHIDGLEVLLGADKNLFAEYWIRRDQFESGEDFMGMHDLFAKMRPEIEKASSIYDRSKVFEKYYDEHKTKFKNYIHFRQEYTLFEQIARRVMGMRAEEKT